VKRLCTTTLLVTLVLASSLGVPTPAGAADEPASYLAGAYATGTWGGLRSDLAARGVEIAVIYTAEVSRTTTPVHDHEPLDYLNLIDGWLDVDSSKLGLWDGGRLLVGVQHAGSTDHDHRLRPYQDISNIDSPAFTQLGECFLEQRLWGDVFWVRIGKQDTNRDFGAPRYPGNFLNGSYGGLPTIPMPSYPTPAVGLMLGTALTNNVRMRGGVFEGRPEYGGLGMDTVFDEGRGVFSMATLEFVTFEPSEGRQSVRHALGVWYHSADQARAAAGALGRAPANQGVFMVLDQRIYRGAGGLHAFGRGALTHAAVGNASAYAGVGLAYHAPFASRDDDTVGVGVSTVWLEQVRGRDAETFVEVFYKARFTRFFSLEPDVQYFHHPLGGSGSGWAFTLRGRVKL
jgi:porin